MTSRRITSHYGPLASVFAAITLIAIGAGCSTTPTTGCGTEPDLAVCGRLGFECGGATVCYLCGVAKRVDCGSCGDTQTCGGGGDPHKCWPPLDAGAGVSNVGDAALADANATPTSTDASPDATPASPDAAADASVDVTDASLDAPPNLSDAADDAADATLDAASDATVGVAPDADVDAAANVPLLCSDSNLPPDAASE